ncbi:Mitochondrial glycoprotein [Penicillium robsamsonii]|uniref:Mitochondrial glycoprotein n=1 Tax=Penicillium robsamsonii TaxID=1792511 RepID=UPI002548EE37|nr:Mitochondrial glycoprotein [Penicillium robsamsonii]KAJ5816486.1 Mitochondrial glycoprotein [Penicillium robsamsonii]
MLSLRTITRSIPRTFSRSITTSALRPAFPKPALQSWKQANKPTYAAFSTSSVFKAPSSEVDIDLLAKLEDELRHEKSSEIPEFEEQQEAIDDVVKHGEWQVKDVAGEQEVILTKKFGTENIRVSFTVADIQNISEQEDFDDASLTDEMDFQNQSRGQDAEASAEEDLEHPEPSFPARVTITVEKPNNGALLIQTVVQDGVFQIEEVSHFAKAELAQSLTAEKDWARQSLYAGPPFENLDEDLQGLWDRYLEDRGLNAEFANMVPDYISVKEQKEYMRWLETVKNFIGA